MIITTAGATALSRALSVWTLPDDFGNDITRERFDRERIGRWTEPEPVCPIHGTELLHAPATGERACADPTCRYAHGYPEPRPGPDVCGPNCHHEPEDEIGSTRHTDYARPQDTL